MRPPPPVAVRAGGGPVWRGVQAALPALGVAVLKLWTLRLAGVPMTVAAPAALLLGSAIGAWLWRREAGRTKALAWDGAAWTVDGTPATPTITLDLGGWLLLRLRTGPVVAAGDAGASGLRPTSWLAVCAHEAGPSWHGLRVALVAQVGPPEGASLPASLPSSLPSSLPASLPDDEGAHSGPRRSG